MKVAVLFGMGPSGLFIAQQLSKLNFRIIGVGRKDDIGLYSKYVESYIAESDKEVMEIVEKVVSEDSNRPYGIICSDQYLTMILKNCSEIFDLLDFRKQDKDLFQIINSKSKVDELCKKFNFNTPRVYKYSNILKNKDVQFPLVFKMDSKQTSSKGNPIGKIKVVNNFEELQSLITSINSVGITDNEIVVQQFIEGDNRNQFSFGGYFNAGVEVAGIIVNQVRQYPQGVSSLVFETQDTKKIKVLRDNANNFAREINYSGFLEMEYKFSKTDQAYLMDINPRPWGWISILGVKYPKFHELLDADIPTEIFRNDDLCMWKSPLRNIVGYFKNNQNVKNLKSINFNKKYMKQNKAYDIYNTNDLRPSLAIFIIAIKKIFSKGG